MANGWLIMRREIRHMWRDPGLRVILLVGPLLGLLLFSAIYRFAVLENISTAIVDLDRSSQSRELAAQIEQSQYLQVIAMPPNYQALQQMIEKGQVVVGVVIPENYAEDMIHRQPTRILAIVDGSNMIFATNASSALLSIAGTISAETGVRTLISRGFSPSEAQGVYQAVQFREQAWFNPMLNYAYFLVLALALNIWQQCCTIAAAFNIVGETGAGSWRLIRAAGFSPWIWLGWKSLAQILVFVLLVLPLYGLSFLVFHLPLSTGFSCLFLLTVSFVLALHGIGSMMSSLATNPVDATRLGMLVALPSFVLSGYTWPVEAMPEVLRHLVWVLPQTWFFQGLNQVLFKTPTLSAVIQYSMPMWFTAAVCYAVTAAAVKRRHLA